MIFVGMAVPFKVMVLIPGLTEVRPVNAIPIVAGLLFGPAGAWGCAFGNLAADFFGTFSIASVFGFVGNFVAAYLPYKIWHITCSGEVPNVKTHKNIGRFVFMSAAASLCVAVILSFSLDVLNMVWGSSIFLMVFLNDLGFSLILGLPVFIVLTSDQLNIKAVIPENVSYSKNNLIFKKLLLLIIVASGIVFSFGVLRSARLLESSVMVVSSVMFGAALAAFMIKK